jgi:hypothetical protein
MQVLPLDRAESPEPRQTTGKELEGHLKERRAPLGRERRSGVFAQIFSHIGPLQGQDLSSHWAKEMANLAWGAIGAEALDLGAMSEVPPYILKQRTASPSATPLVTGKIAPGK